MIFETSETSYLTHLPWKEFMRIKRYSSGGFHPVHLGDEYTTERRRYRILHKLGDGAYSQVWFGQDVSGTDVKASGVAMKFVVSGSTGKTNEVAINKYIASLSHHSENIMACRDIFQIDGPNGIHSVIVTSPSIFLLDLCHDEIIEDLDELEIVRQIFQGVSFLHRYGVVHRDLHIGNIAIHFPFLSTVQVPLLMRALQRPRCTPCLASTSGAHPASVPDYFVKTPKFCEKFRSTMRRESQSIIVKIVDFGCAFRPNTDDAISSESGGPNLWLTAPECLTSHPSAAPPGPLETTVWTTGSDIWTLGCSLVTLLSRGTISTIFSRPDSTLGPQALLSNIAKFLGPPDNEGEQMREKYSSSETKASTNDVEIDTEGEQKGKHDSSFETKESWSDLEIDTEGDQKGKRDSFSETKASWSDVEIIEPKGKHDSSSETKESWSDLEIDNEGDQKGKHDSSSETKESWSELEISLLQKRQSLHQSRPKQLDSKDKDTSPTQRDAITVGRILSLLKGMLRWDPKRRSSAKEALDILTSHRHNSPLPGDAPIPVPGGDEVTHARPDSQSPPAVTEYSDPSGKYMWSLPIANAESPAEYCEGGLHPVHLDEVYPGAAFEAGRYRIINKLEFRSSAHVWFAQNVRQADPMIHGVAIKFVASRYTGKTNEVAINRYLATRPQEDLGFRSFLPLLDVFQVHGPNGTHEVFVTDLTIRLLDVCVSDDRINLIEDMDETQLVQQILRGVSFLHKHGIVHRDLRCQNIAITFPFMDTVTVHEVMVSSQTVSDLYPCILSDPCRHPPSLPKYIVKRSGAWNMLKSRMQQEASLFVVKLLDFGHAYRPGTTDVLVKNEGAPIALTSPECIADPQTASNWSFQSDIWTLGCSLFELHSRKFNQNHLFGGSGTSSLGSEIAKLLGPVPESFRSLLDIRLGSSPLNEGNITQPPAAVDPTVSAESYDEASVAANWGLLRVSLLHSRAPQPSSWFPPGFFPSETPLNAIDEQIRVKTETNTIEGFLSLMKLMLRWNPEDRISAEEALKLPLFQQVSQ